MAFIAHIKSPKFASPIAEVEIKGYNWSFWDNFDPGKWDFGNSQEGGGTPELIQKATGDDAKAKKAAWQAEELKKQQLGYADEMEDPGYQEGMFRPIRDQRLMDLQADIKQNRANLGRRGLLYGGIAEGSGAKSAAAASSDLSSLKTGIKNTAESGAAQIRSEVLDQGLKQRRTQQQLYDTIYNSALKDYQAKRQAFAQMGGLMGAAVGTVVAPGAGTAAGYYAGSKVFE